MSFLRELQAAVNYDLKHGIKPDATAMRMLGLSMPKKAAPKPKTVARDADRAKAVARGPTAKVHTGAKVSKVIAEHMKADHDRHCSKCGFPGHNARSCTKKTSGTTHCSLCGHHGHNKRSCYLN
jgi:hypothetical protein